jgi:hypothetical protein
MHESLVARAYLIFVFIAWDPHPYLVNIVTTPACQKLSRGKGVNLLLAVPTLG